MADTVHTTETNLESLTAARADLARAATVCRRGAEHLDAVPAADVVNALAGIHERDLAHLQRLAMRLGFRLGDAGVAIEETSTARVRRARAEGGDGAVLALIDEIEETATTALTQLGDAPELPDEFRTLAASSLDELRRRHERLRAASRVAA